MQAGVYKHYKGGLYQVLGVARHSETNERMVVYVSLTGAHLPGPRMNARPKAMFEGTAVDDEGFQVLRFEYIGDEIPQEKPKHGVELCHGCGEGAEAHPNTAVGCMEWHSAEMAYAERTR